MAEPSPTLSVSELADRIGAGLREAFPDEIWVRGEIQDLPAVPGHHSYFTLADAEGTDDAHLPVVLLNRDKQRVNRLLMKAGQRVRMTNGTEVRIRGRLDWYAPRGKLQLRMVSIDPEFTLGQLAAARAIIVERLRADGLLDRNRSLPMPLVPLRVGVVTSSGSAAEADVLDELHRSGFAFDHRVTSVRVQGADAPQLIAGAIRWFADRPPGGAFDVLLVVRGGGAATDLAAFDEELVARAVAESPIPIISGVGHETDRTIIDEVSHTASKTPTAAAQHLVGLVAEAFERAERAFAGVAVTAGARLRREADHLDRLADRAATGAASATRAEQARLGHLTDRLGRVGATRLDRGSVSLDDTARRLRVAAHRAVDDADRRLAHLAGRTSAVDPVRALARGWSITRTSDGAVVRSATDAAPGADLVTTLAEGTIRSTVTARDDTT